jgi:hypothetical protein
MVKRLLGVLAGGAALVGLLIAHAHTITIADARLSAGTVTVSGNKGAVLADITWQGRIVTRTNKDGAFTFATTVAPQDCVGTLSDGVRTVDVAISDCASFVPAPTTAFPTTCWDGAASVIAQQDNERAPC